MPNALDAHNPQHKILMLGDTGGGKTSQILTLPGKKFVYCFDPNALLSLKGHDVEYAEFLADQVSFSVHSLGKGKGDTGSGAKSSDLYLKWEQDFNERMKDGFFDSYDVICMDSATTFLDLIMDRVLTLNGRFGQWPNQDDYGPQMIAFQNVCRYLTSSGKMVYMTGHLDMKQDGLTKRIFVKPMMTGRLTAKIPLLFSSVFVAKCEVDSQTGQSKYMLQTKPDNMTTCIRTSIKGLEAFEDVTINWDESPVGQGLGGILNWSAKQNG